MLSREEARTKRGHLCGHLNFKQSFIITMCSNCFLAPLGAIFDIFIPLKMEYAGIEYWNSEFESILLTTDLKKCLDPSSLVSHYII